MDLEDRLDGILNDLSAHDKLLLMMTIKQFIAEFEISYQSVCSFTVL